MKSVKEEIPLHTFGMGKVMSAGVLLLAAGTKGERRIGKNCRVMIHHVAGGVAGALPSMEADLDSIKAMEERYVQVLISETKFTKRSLKKLLDKRVNIYLSAEEAIEYGIADKYI
jgi:ATP-dependent Clp protease protease subunit